MDPDRQSEVGGLGGSTNALSGVKRHHCVTRLTDGHHSREAVGRQREGGIGHQFRLYFLQFDGNTDFDLLFCLSITLLLVLRFSFLQSVLEPNLSHTYPQPYFPQIPPSTCRRISVSF